MLIEFYTQKKDQNKVVRFECRGICGTTYGTTFSTIKKKNTVITFGLHLREIKPI